MNFLGLIKDLYTENVHKTFSSLAQCLFAYSLAVGILLS